MTEYNGHRSWNAWNVSLWISGDEHLYKTAWSILCDTAEHGGTIGKAVNTFIRYSCILGDKTPDGAVYNRLSIRLALINLEHDAFKHLSS